MLDVEVTGIARLTRASLPHLRRSAHPAVVNTCSAVALSALAAALYAADALNGQHGIIGQ